MCKSVIVRCIHPDVLKCCRTRVLQTIESLTFRSRLDVKLRYRLAQPLTDSAPQPSTSLSCLSFLVKTPNTCNSTVKLTFENACRHGI